MRGERGTEVIPKQTTAYYCNMCGNLYRNQRDAEECCPVEEVGHWDCGREICPRLIAALPHRTEEEARECAAKGGEEVMKQELTAATILEALERTLPAEPPVIHCSACEQAGTTPTPFEPPPLVISPTIGRGQPTFGTSTLGARFIAKGVYEGGVEQVCENYPFLSTNQILLACWWMGTGGSKKWLRRWGEWALDAGRHMAYDCGTFPYPPTRKATR